MTDFAEARTIMVDNQVRTSDVTSHALIAAMKEVPREAFVPDELKPLAYIDEDLSLAPLGPVNRFMMAPAQFARLCQLADIQPDDVVMVVGAGSGYECAVISLMCSSVVAVEEDEVLAQLSEERLSELGYGNVAVVTGNPAAGWPKEAPFDVIFINGSVDFVPEPLLEQVHDDGHLVAVEGTGNAAVAKLYRRHDGHVDARAVMNSAIPPLPGFRQEPGFTF